MPRTFDTIRCGNIMKIAGRDYIVLDINTGDVSLLAKDPACRMEFGGDGDYAMSKVRNYLNGDFYRELAASVGEENIVEHTVRLIADDGTGKGIVVNDKISLLTTDMYRRYREYIPALGTSWWTATRVTHNNDTGYARHVCCVSSGGILNWNVCDFGNDVRPFCILKSSFFMS